MTSLSERHCQPVSGNPLGNVEIAQYLRQCDGWHHKDGAIQKVFKFKDFPHTMAFVNAVAWIAHREDHHPDMAVGYGQCMVRFNTHSVNGLSINDFICAAKTNALLQAAS